MPQSHAQVYLHICFSTKNREKLISPEIEKQLHKYITGIIKNLECQCLTVNGTSDHVHILIRQSRKISISKLIMEIKKGSSVWVKTLGVKHSGFSWQKGYGVFSVSPSNIKNTIKYIADQKDHHKKKTFKEEYLTFLKSAGISYDEQYLWD